MFVRMLLPDQQCEANLSGATLSGAHLNIRLDGMDAHLETMNTRLDRLETKADAIETQLTEQKSLLTQILAHLPEKP